MVTQIRSELKSTVNTLLVAIGQNNPFISHSDISITTILKNYHRSAVQLLIATMLQMFVSQMKIRYDDRKISESSEL